LIVAIELLKEVMFTFLESNTKALTTLKYLQKERAKLVVFGDVDCAKNLVTKNRFATTSVSRFNRQTQTFQY
jgi:hypothetical protein